jgi:hypothetical protein
MVSCAINSIYALNINVNIYTHMQSIYGKYEMMKIEQVNSDEQSGGLVDLPRLLEQLFPNPECRPSARWGRTQVANRTIPFIRVGRLCFFNTAMVQAHFHAAAMKKVRAV